jgi:hypothetical protein
MTYIQLWVNAALKQAYSCNESGLFNRTQCNDRHRQLSTIDEEARL